MRQLLKTMLLPIADKQDIQALKDFALSMAIAFPVVFSLLLPWLLELAVPAWPMYLSLSLVILYFVKPSGLYYPYYAWMVFASILGWLNTRIILAIAFYCLIVPMGVVMQLLGKLQFKKTINDDSTWLKRTDKLNKDNLKDPF